jgi:alpha-L-fucosidase 2
MAGPATDWRDASPVGNGVLGGLHFGALAGDRILLNHERLFARSVTPDLPDISDALPEVRRLLAAGDFAAANALYAARLQSAGYRAWAGEFLPGPVLHWHAPGSGGRFRAYRRWIDFAAGTVGLGWTSPQGHRGRSVFVSAAARALVFELQEEKGGRAEAELWLAPQDATEHTDKDGRTLPLEIAAESRSGAEWLAARFVGPGDADCAAVVHWRGAVAVRETGRGVVLRHEGRAALLVSVLVGAGWPEIEAEAGRLAALAPVADLAAEHRAAHGARYGRTRFDLAVGAEAEWCNEELLLRAYQGEVPDALIARLANYGRYLLISSCGPGTLPPNLQGIWNGNFAPPWWGNFFFNENIQMALWAALPGGLPECAATLFDLLESRMDDFRANARRLYGCRGILLPLYMSPDSGLQKDLQSHVLYWTGGGAWLAAHYFAYWRHTGDEAFLRRRALPFLREVALFYEDFLTEDEDGILHASPANSPENHPRNLIGPDGRSLRICADPASEFALVRELLGHLLSASAAAGEGSAEETARWQGLLARLPDYRINSEGALAEWIDPRFEDHYRHRHLSHLYALFPGHGITADNKTLFEACRVAAAKRLETGLEAQTGWSLVHHALVQDRLGAGDRALECLHLLCRSVVGANLFTAHNDLRGMGLTAPLRVGPRPAVQLEANLGVTAAVYEMLVQTPPGRLRLLPALPTAWRRGSLTGLHLPDGGLLDLRWDAGAGRWQAAVTFPAPCTLEITGPPDQTAVFSGEVAAGAPLELEGRWTAPAPAEALS